MRILNFAVKPVSQSTAAGKLTDRRSSHALLRGYILTGLVSLVGILAFGASAAHAEEPLSPWWHLVIQPRPSYLQPGKAKDAVQRFTSGTLETEGAGLYESGGSSGYDEGQQVSVAAGEAPEEVQQALEGAYGANNVEVTSTAPFASYEVKFVGELADQPVGLMRGATEVVEGRPDGEIVVNATNLGDAPVNPEEHPVTITDKLPPGLVAVGSIRASISQPFKMVEIGECSLKTVSCTFTTLARRSVPREVVPAHELQMVIAVNVAGAQTGAVDEASISGGAAPPTTTKRAVTVSDAPIPFGVSLYEIRPEEVGGKLDTQAGSHPFQLTTTLNFNETLEPKLFPTSSVGGFPLFSAPAGGAAKDLSFNLPAGLIGDPQSVPACPLATFLQIGGGNGQNNCPLASVVGFAIPDIYLTETIFLPFQGPIYEPLFNLEPAVGEPARFGFEAYASPVILDTSVRTGSDYGVTVSVSNITQTAEFLGSEVTFWGVPGDPRHKNQRCEHGLGEGTDNGPACPSSEEQASPPPFLSLPTSCTGPMATSVEGDSWGQQARRNAEGLPVLESPLVSSQMGAVDGCNHLPFEPSIKVAPDSTEASKPTGLNVDVHVNQESILSASGLAESDVKNITVALPEGVAINPSGGDGLQACSANPAVAPETPGNQIGYKGLVEPPLQPGVNVTGFSPHLPGTIAARVAGEAQPLEPGVDFCANASKIAEVTIKSPLLPLGQYLKGFVYLAAQEANPFGSLIAMYLVAEDPISGTLVKLPGVVHLQPNGQIVTTFANNPQLPFEDAELHFFGGERAPLASPAHCGTYTTQASFEPWSGNAPIGASSSFDVKSGPDGSACPGASLPFSPSLTAGTTNINAGGFSPFTMTMSRASGQQNLQSVELKLPEGLSGILSGVELCPEPQADQGLCGPNSLIGETTVGVGVGGDPFSVKGGRVYITGPYEGAPFGLSIVNPAKAGPYDLANTANNKPACDCVLVRAKIEVNPITAALTVTSDNTGPYKIPTSIEGIPLQIQHVNVTITRPNFQFNPTNCSKLAIGGNLAAAEGATMALSVPFQATNCAALKFAPKFSVSTKGKTSKAKGASLTAKVTYPQAAAGTYANVARVKVELPKALPSRLTTLQKACTAKQFELNPAGCPAPSFIGHALVHTPLLPVPLEGPAIFVSHGGEAFPSLEIVLQGYGVTVDLVGSTFISKSGITSTTFKTVPDQPFSSFELTLPEGPYSALAANGNLCNQKLTMPNEYIGQNGAAIHQVTPISVEGCKKAKALTRTQKLAKALKACHKDRNKGRRQKCEKAARTQFGPAKQKKGNAKRKQEKS